MNGNTLPQGEIDQNQEGIPSGDEKYRPDIIYVDGEKMEVLVPKDLAIRDQFGSIIEGGFY